MLESRVLALSAPTPRSLDMFKRWYLHYPRPVLWGRDKDLFRNEQDLVALAPVETDRLNIFLQKYLGWFLKVSAQKTPRGWEFERSRKNAKPQVTKTCSTSHPGVFTELVP